MKTLLKTAFTTAFLSFAVFSSAQVLSTSTGEINFYSKTPVEDIAAKNTKVSAALNTATGEVLSIVTIKDFAFPNKLMQEHFNENYMESDKFPKAIFKGKVADPSSLAKPGTYKVSAPGKMTIHGVEKEYNLVGTLVVAADKTTLDCSFDVLLTDHNIERPSIVMVKIAEKINVKASYVLLPRK